MSGYSHILFDHDGVLVDTEPLYYQATRESLAELGVALELPDYLRIQAVGGNAWQQALDRGVSAAAVAEHKAQRNRRYQQLLREQPIDIDGVEAVLAELRRHFSLAIVTTAKQDDFDLIHASRGIVPYMDLVLTNADYTHSKPHPEPYLTALAHFGIEPSQALVIEDSERGLMAAVAAGIDCAVVHHPFTQPQDFSRATYRIDRLAELPGLLEIG